MNKLKYILFFFFLLIPATFSLTFTETFDNICERDSENLDNFTLGATTNDVCAGDNGFYYIFDINTLTNTPSNFTDYLATPIVSGYQFYTLVPNSAYIAYSVLYHEFTDEIGFTNNTVIRYYGNTTQTTDSGLSNMNILFLESDDECSLLFGGDNNGFINSSVCQQSLDWEFYNSMNNLNLTNGNQPASKQYNVTYTGQEIFGLKKMLIMFSGIIGSNYAVLDHFEIDNYINGTNLLPFFNISVDSSYHCVNLSYQFPYTVNLNVSAYDKEGDTIRYGVATDHRFYTYSNDLTIENSDGSNTLTDYQNFLSNCAIDLGGSIYNDTDHLFYQIYTFNNRTEYVYNPRGTCPNVNRDTYIEFALISRAVEFSFGIDNFGTGDIFNVSLLSSSGIRTEYDFVLMFNKTNSIVDIDILLNNGSEYNLFNYVDNGDYFRLIFDNAINTPNTYDFDVVYKGDSKNNSVRNFKVSDPYGNYGGINLITDSSSNIVFTDYIELTSVDDITFTETQPSQITFNRPQSKFTTIYVTDDAHSTNDYKFTNLNVLVEQKEYCTQPLQIDDHIDLIIGNTFKTYFDNTNTRNMMLKFMWFMFIVLFLFFIVTMYLSSQNIHILIPLVLSSLISLVFSILVTSPTHIISFIITGMLGVAGLVKNSHN